MLVLFPKVFVTSFRIVVSLVSIIFSGQLNFPVDCSRLTLRLLFVFLICCRLTMLFLDLPGYEFVVNTFVDVDPDFGVRFFDFMQVLLRNVLRCDSVFLEVLRPQVLHRSAFVPPIMVDFPHLQLVARSR